MGWPGLAPHRTFPTPLSYPDAQPLGASGVFYPKASSDVCGQRGQRKHQADLGLRIHQGYCEYTRGIPSHLLQIVLGKVFGYVAEGVTDWPLAAGSKQGALCPDWSPRCSGSAQLPGSALCLPTQPLGVAVRTGERRLPPSAVRFGSSPNCHAPRPPNRTDRAIS